MIKLLKQYIKLCIETKKSLNKEIQMLNEITEQLYDITAKNYILFEEYSKESYKIKYKEEHKKVRELEKQLKEVK